MLYIHQTTCISPQNTYASVNIGDLKAPVDNILKVTEPPYAGIQANVLRRMSKSVRLGVGAALPLLKEGMQSDGILIGTGNGGMEDSVRFLKEIVIYNEEMLTPGPFVQSTPNAIASQIGLLSRNNGYNITYVHRGLAFENALLDASMLLEEHPSNSYLVGGVDELSSGNYHLEWLDGWYKKEKTDGYDLYGSGSPGSIAGEGAALFLVNSVQQNALAAVKGIATLHSREEAAVMARLSGFLQRHLPPGEKIDLLLTGENGDNRALQWCTVCEAMMESDTTVARFKHMCGEYPTASAFALWLACHLPQTQLPPRHMVKRQSGNTRLKYILIYNNHKYSQHSFMLVERLL